MDTADVNETLDARGWHDDARGAGCYAIRLSVPDDLEARWMAEFDAAPEYIFDRFPEATTVLYIGAASNVYQRLNDHARSDVRQAAVTRVCPPEEVVDVTPCADPFDREYAYALNLAGPNTVCYCDGQVI